MTLENISIYGIFSLEDGTLLKVHTQFIYIILFQLFFCARAMLAQNNFRRFSNALFAISVFSL